MPFFLFLITLMIALFAMMTTSQIIHSSALSQHFLHSAASFYTAESRTDLTLNQDVPSEADTPRLSFLEAGFQEIWHLPSFEILLNGEALAPLTTVQVDFCLRRQLSHCPELIVEWFQFERGKPFLDLQTLTKDQSPFSLMNGCLSIPSLSLQRCVKKITGELSSDDRFLKSFRLPIDYPRYQYLIRFHSRNRSTFAFRVVGRGGGREVSLPGLFSEIDQQANTKNAFRRIRNQRLISAGLQDGLQFVLSAEEMVSK